MMTVSEVKEWLDTLDPNDGIAIEDDGLALVALEETEVGEYEQSGPYLEVGGIPLPAEDNEDEEDE